MLRIGCWILTLWTVMNGIASLSLLVRILYFDGHTPALYLLLSEADVGGLAPEVLATVDSIAVFANATNVAFCVLVLCMIWRGLRRRIRWSFTALVAGFSIAVLGGVAADAVVHFAAPWVNLTSTALLGAGLGLSWLGLRSDPAGSADSRPRGDSKASESR
ncbi:MAG: hypothetical protein AAFY88_07865 [Acidobacteriota bacterium]